MLHLTLRYPLIQLCSRLQLDLRGNRLGPAGAAALALGLAANGGLTCVDVRYNRITGDGAAQLSAAVLGNLKIEMFNKIPIKEMRADSFTELDLMGKGVGVEGGMVVAGLIPVMGGLTKMSLAGNQLEEEGTKAICEALEQNKTLKELDISGDGFGATRASNIEGSAGAKHVTKMLGVNGGLTRVDVRSNNIAGDGAEQLSAAVLGNLKIEMFNEIPIKEMRANSITELDLMGKGLGVEGVMVVAGLIPVMGGLTSIDVRQNDIAGDGAVQLAAAVLGNLKIEIFNKIPIKEMRANSITKLDLIGQIGVEGGMVVAGLIPVMGGLKELNIAGNSIMDEGITAICNAVQGNKETKLASLNVSFNYISSVGATAVAAMVAVTGSLTALDLTDNNLKDEGVSAVCKAIQSNKETKLASLNFKNNGIRPGGANALAAMVAVTGSLTECGLSYNNMSKEGEALIRKAVEGKAGFKLHL